MEPQQKKIGWFGVLAILIGLGWIINLVNGDDDKKASGPTSASVLGNTEKPTRSRLRLVTNQSFCEASPLDAQIRFTVWFSNPSTSPLSADVIPVRHYNDGSKNASVLDAVTVTIEPGRRQFMSQVYDYNALEHDLIRCGVKVDYKDARGGFSDEIPIPLE